MPRPRLPSQSSRLLLAALLLASSPDGTGAYGKPTDAGDRDVACAYGRGEANLLANLLEVAAVL